MPSGAFVWLPTGWVGKQLSCSEIEKFHLYLFGFCFPGQKSPLGIFKIFTLTIFRASRKKHKVSYFFSIVIILWDLGMERKYLLRYFKANHVSWLSLDINVYFIGVLHLNVGLFEFVRRCTYTKPKGLNNVLFSLYAFLFGVMKKRIAICILLCT